MYFLFSSAQRFAHREGKKNPLQADGLSKITLSGANRWHVSTHQQQKSLSVPKSQAADAQTPLTGTAAPSSDPKPLQGSAAAVAAAAAISTLLVFLFCFLNITFFVCLDTFVCSLLACCFVGVRAFYYSPLSPFPPQHLVE